MVNPHWFFSQRGCCINDISQQDASKRWDRRAGAITFCCEKGQRAGKALNCSCKGTFTHVRMHRLQHVVIMFRKSCFLFIVNRHRDGFLHLFLLASCCSYQSDLLCYSVGGSSLPGEGASLKENELLCDASENGRV